jgi:hypothetical protein
MRGQVGDLGAIAADRSVTFGGEIGNLDVMAVVWLSLMQLDALFGRKPHLAEEAVDVAFGDGDLEFGEEMLTQPVGRPTVKAVAEDFGAMGDEVFESIEVGLIDGFGPPHGLGWGIGGRSGLIGILTLGH